MLEKTGSVALLPAYHVKPVVEPAIVRKHAKKHADKRFFREVEDGGEVELVYYPFYVVDAECTCVEKFVGFRFIETEVEIDIELTLFIDAVKGAVLVLRNKVVNLVRLPPVSQEEATVLATLLSNEVPVSVDYLEYELEWSRQKIDELLAKLLEKGLVGYEDFPGRRKAVRFYYPAVPTVHELEETGDALKLRVARGMPADGRVIEPSVPFSDAFSVVSSIYSMKLIDKRLVYLPVYVVRYHSAEDDGNHRYVYFLACKNPPLPFKGTEIEIRK